MKIKLLSVVFLLCLSFFSCGRGTQGENPITPTDPPITEKPVDTSPSNLSFERKIEYLKKQLESFEKKVKEYTEKNDTVNKLIAEKEALNVNIKIAETYSDNWKQSAENYKKDVGTKDEEIKVAKLDAWKVKLWVMSGICGFLGIVFTAVAFGLPLLRPIATKAAIVLGAVSIIMLIVAQSLTTIAWLLGFVPYIIGFAVLVALAYGVYMCKLWWIDHKSLEQTISGIEPIKSKMEGFKNHMLEYVDKKQVDHIAKYRDSLKKIKEKIKPKI
jgi:hypothetical protein